MITGLKTQAVLLGASYRLPVHILYRSIPAGLGGDVSFADAIIAKYSSADDQPHSSADFVYPKFGENDAGVVLTELSRQLIQMNRIRIRMNMRNYRIMQKYSLTVSARCDQLLNMLQMKTNVYSGVSQAAVRDLTRIHRELKEKIAAGIPEHPVMPSALTGTDLREADESALILRILTAASRGNGTRERYMRNLISRMQSLGDTENQAIRSPVSKTLISMAEREIFRIQEREHGNSMTLWLSEDARRFFWRIQRAPEAVRDIFLNAAGFTSLMTFEKVLKTMNTVSFRSFAETLMQQVSVSFSEQSSVSAYGSTEREYGDEEWLTLYHNVGNADKAFSEGTFAAELQRGGADSRRYIENISEEEWNWFRSEMIHADRENILERKAPELFEALTDVKMTGEGRLPEKTDEITDVFRIMQSMDHETFSTVVSPVLERIRESLSEAVISDNASEKSVDEFHSAHYHTAEMILAVVTENRNRFYGADGREASVSRRGTTGSETSSYRQGVSASDTVLREGGMTGSETSFYRHGMSASETVSREGGMTGSEILSSRQGVSVPEIVSREGGTIGSETFSYRQGVSASETVPREGGMTGSETSSSRQGMPASEAVSHGDGTTGSAASAYRKDEAGSEAAAYRQGMSASETHYREQAVTGSEKSADMPGMSDTENVSQMPGTTGSEAAGNTQGPDVFDRWLKAEGSDIISDLREPGVSEYSGQLSAGSEQSWEVFCSEMIYADRDGKLRERAPELYRALVSGSGGSGNAFRGSAGRDSASSAAERTVSRLLIENIIQTMDHETYSSVVQPLLQEVAGTYFVSLMPENRTYNSGERDDTELSLRQQTMEQVFTAITKKNRYSFGNDSFSEYLTQFFEQHSDEDWNLFRSELIYADHDEELKKKIPDLYKAFAEEYSGKEPDDADRPAEILREKELFFRILREERGTMRILRTMIIEAIRNIAVIRENQKEFMTLAESIMDLTSEQWNEFKHDVRVLHKEDLDIRQLIPETIFRETVSKEQHSSLEEDVRRTEEHLTRQETLQTGIRMSTEKMELLRILQQETRRRDTVFTDAGRKLFVRTVLRESDAGRLIRPSFRELSSESRESWRSFVTELLHIDSRRQTDGTRTGAGYFSALADLYGLSVGNGAAAADTVSRSETAVHFLEQRRQERILDSKTITAREIASSRTENRETQVYRLLASRNEVIFPENAETVPEQSPADITVQRMAANTETTAQIREIEQGLKKEESRLRTEVSHDIEFETVRHTVSEQSTGRELKRVSEVLDRHEREIAGLLRAQKADGERDLPREVIKQINDRMRMERLRGGF